MTIAPTKTANQKLCEFNSNQKIEVSGKTIAGNHNTIRGNNNEVIGNFNLVIGNENQVYGKSNKVCGDECTITGDFNEVFGNNNRIFGQWCYVSGENNCIPKNKLPQQQNHSLQNKLQLDSHLTMQTKKDIRVERRQIRNPTRTKFNFRGGRMVKTSTNNTGIGIVSGVSVSVQSTKFEVGNYASVVFSSGCIDSAIGTKTTNGIDILTLEGIQATLIFDLTKPVIHKLVSKTGGEKLVIENRKLKIGCTQNIFDFGVVESVVFKNNQFFNFQSMQLLFDFNTWKSNCVK